MCERIESGWTKPFLIAYKEQGQEQHLPRVQQMALPSVNTFKLGMDPELMHPTCEELWDEWNNPLSPTLALWNILPVHDLSETLSICIIFSFWCYKYEHAAAPTMNMFRCSRELPKWRVLKLTYLQAGKNILNVFTMSSTVAFLERVAVAGGGFTPCPINFLNWNIFSSDLRPCHPATPALFLHWTNNLQHTRHLLMNCTVRLEKRNKPELQNPNSPHECIY